MQREVRDVMLFVLGTILGILGNMFAEYWIAYTYPEGVPQDHALGGAYVMALLMVVYGFVVVWVIKKSTKG